MIHKAKPKIIMSWALVVAWMLLIFYFSAQPAVQSNQLSKGLTSYVIILLNFFKAISIETSTFENWIEILNGTIREYTHGAVFLVLGFLVAYALKNSGVKDVKGYIYAFVIVTVYACTDELHQMIVPGRAAELSDLLMDISGATIGIAIMAIGRGRALIADS